MAVLTKALDVPTGSDALEPALDVGNLFRCRPQSTGDDTELRGFEDWVGQAIAAMALRSVEDKDQAGSGQVPWRAVGDIVVRYQGRIARMAEMLGDPQTLTARMTPAPGENRSEEASDSKASTWFGFSRLPAALRLKELCGLDVGLLAGVLDVSRPTFHQWMKGNPRGPNLARLLEVLSLVEDAAETRGIGELDVWLQHPVGARGPRPLDLLKDARYDAFVGFVHRVPIEQRLMRRPAGRPSRMPYRPVSRPLESIVTSAWEEDDD